MTGYSRVILASPRRAPCAPQVRMSVTPGWLIASARAAFPLGFFLQAERLPSSHLPRHDVPSAALVRLPST
jgi:hypothetical protein